mmetsp:Transcript_4164/g.8950  ORF Transcript_4164/g.8950 Transcript_4164/m.8950 type:complete len:186 (-) Transcript_4164:143-700(-)
MSQGSGRNGISRRSELKRQAACRDRLPVVDQVHSLLTNHPKPQESSWTGPTAPGSVGKGICKAARSARYSAREEDPVVTFQEELIRQQARPPPTAVPPSPIKGTRPLPLKSMLDIRGSRKLPGLTAVRSVPRPPSADGGFGKGSSQGTPSERPGRQCQVPPWFTAALGDAQLFGSTPRGARGFRY